MKRPTPSVDRGPATPALAEVSDRNRAGLALAPPPAPAAEGDDGDLESVYRRHGSRVSRWAARLIGPGFEVEDIVHDVFLVVQRRLGEFRGDALISTWLYEITVRVVQAHRRKRRRRRWIWPFWLEEHLEATPHDQIADDRLSPLDALERRQATALLYRMLDTLDEKYRTPVVLFELEGLSCQEIAAITGTSISNVWARVSRGRERLTRAFAQAEAKNAT